jgi:hypothetical protein
VGDGDQRELLLLARLQDVVRVVDAEGDAPGLGLRHHPVDRREPGPAAHHLDVEAIEEALLDRRRRPHRLVVDEPGFEHRHLRLGLGLSIRKDAPRRKAGEDEHQREGQEPKRSHHRRVLL